MWIIAIKAMLAEKGKLLTSLSGVVFSVVLVNLQGGLLLGMIQKASLLVDRFPGGKVLGQIAPRGTATDQPAGGVEDVAEVVDALACVLGEQAEVRDDELPLGVGDITGVELVCDHILYYDSD
jgi:hypothetical protein